MARVSDLVCAVAIGPAGAILAIAAGMLLGLLGGATADTAVLGGVAVFGILPPATIVLRARVRGMRLDGTCLLLLLTLVSMAATIGVLVGTMSFAYGWVMRDF